MSEPDTTNKRRRHSGEAPPPDRRPEDESSVAMGEAEPSVTEGVYFTKAPNRDYWHAFDEDDNPIGGVYRALDDRWHVKVNGREMPSHHGAATGARAFLAGYHLGRQSMIPVRVESSQVDEPGRDDEEGERVA